MLHNMTLLSHELILFGLVVCVFFFLDTKTMIMLLVYKEMSLYDKKYEKKNKVTLSGKPIRGSEGVT